MKLAAINARANDINYCQYEAGDAAYRLEHLAPLEPASRWQAAGFDESASIPQATDALADPPRAGLSPRALDALMILAFAFIESLAIYALVISFILLYANPYA